MALTITVIIIPIPLLGSVMASVTPIDAFFSYLSTEDEVVDYQKQYDVIDAMGMLSVSDTVDVDNSITPFSDSHCLHTRQVPGIAILNHNVTTKLSAINNTVWTYMLTSEIKTSTSDMHQSDLIVYPNPSENSFNVVGNDIGEQVDYRLLNIYGAVVKSGSLIDSNNVIDVLDISPGIYYLELSDHVVKVIKL